MITGEKFCSGGVPASAGLPAKPLCMIKMGD